MNGNYSVMQKLQQGKVRNDRFIFGGCGGFRILKEVCGVYEYVGYSAVVVFVESRLDCWT